MYTNYKDVLIGNKASVVIVLRDENRISQYTRTLSARELMYSPKGQE